MGSKTFIRPLTKCLAVYTIINCHCAYQRKRSTIRAMDVWESPRFSGFFLGLAVFRFQASSD